MGQAIFPNSVPCLYNGSAPWRSRSGGGCIPELEPQSIPQIGENRFPVDLGDVGEHVGVCMILAEAMKMGGDC